MEKDSKRIELNLIARKIIEFPGDVAMKIEKYRKAKDLKSFKEATIRLILVGYDREEPEVDLWWKGKG